MKLLGLSAGNPDGSAEILLKEALRGAEAAGADVELVRLHDLRLSAGPGAGAEDAGWFWDRLMESDGLIVSSPIYTRTIPGLLRLLGDRISGPQSDVAFTAEILRMRESGEPLAVDFVVDERVLRPRVAGFIAVGGSLPTRWKGLALPLLHTLTASAQIAVVDQVEFAGAGSPASIVLDAAALERARRLGEAVGSQLGRSYDEAEYRGDPGVCPLCHLSAIIIFDDRVECATCGAVGTLTVADGGHAFAFSPEGLKQSILSYDEKLEHFHEVQQTAAEHASRRSEITDRAAEYAAWDPRITPGETT
jgi:multimeric flavodoxin WrbA